MADVPIVLLNQSVNTSGDDYSGWIDPENLIDFKKENKPVFTIKFH